MVSEGRVSTPVTEAEITAIAHAFYGLDAIIQSLPSEYDNNFHLITAGREYILKVMHGSRERAFIDMQQSVLQHLARTTPHLVLPKVCPARDHALTIKVTLADGQERLAWLLTYLPGTLLADVHPQAIDLLESLGRWLGEMDAALKGFSCPAAHRVLKWDLAQAGWIREYLHCIADPSRRRIVDHFLSLYETEVVPALPRLRKSVIHGDANDYNVLVSAPWPQPRKVESVIDFGDMHYTATVCELAIATAYAILRKENPLQAAAAGIDLFAEASTPVYALWESDSPITIQQLSSTADARTGTVKTAKNKLLFELDGLGSILRTPRAHRDRTRIAVTSTLWRLADAGNTKMRQSTIQSPGKPSSFSNENGGFLDAGKYPKTVLTRAGIRGERQSLRSLATG